MREAEARRSRAQVDGQKRVEEEARAVEEAQMEANDPIARLARQQQQQQQQRGLALPPTVPEMKDGQGAGQWGTSGEAKGQGQGQDYDTEEGAITPNTFGPHLKRVSALEATARVHRRFGSNNQPVASAASTGDGDGDGGDVGDGGDGRSRRGGDSELEKRLAAMPYNIHAEDMQDIQRHPAMDEFPDAASFLAYVGERGRGERRGKRRMNGGSIEYNVCHFCVLFLR